MLSMDWFSTSCQIPQGQAPAQKPQPMQRSGSTAYSYAPPGRSFLEMAFWGQIVTQTEQSRQEPQEAHSPAQSSMSPKPYTRGS